MNIEKIESKLKIRFHNVRYFVLFVFKSVQYLLRNEKKKLSADEKVLQKETIFVTCLKEKFITVLFNLLEWKLTMQAKSSLMSIFCLASQSHLRLNMSFGVRNVWFIKSHSFYSFVTHYGWILSLYSLFMGSRFLF